MEHSRRKGPAVLACLVILLVIIACTLFFLTRRKTVPTQSAPSGEDVSEARTPISETVAPVVDQPEDKSKEELAEVSPEEEYISEADVYGKVKNEKGEAVAGAEVAAVQVETAARSYDATTTTGRDGAYELNGLNTNNPFPYKIIASATNYASAASDRFFFDGTPTRINITLAKGVTLKGQVTDTSGGSIEGASIYLAEISTGFQIPWNLEAPGSRTSVTDSDGGFHFKNVPPGTYSVSALLRNCFHEKKKLTINALDAEQTCNFTLEYAGDGFVAGVVVDEAGNLIEDATVTSRQVGRGEHNGKIIYRWCRTSADGKFRLDGYLENRDQFHYTEVRATKEGYHSDFIYIRTYSPEQTKDTDVHNLLLELKSLDQSCTVSGNVFDSITSKPLRRFSIALMERYPGKRCLEIKTFDSPSGSFSFSGIHMPYPQLQVRAKGYASQFVHASFYNKTEDYLEIELEPEGTVSGKVYDMHTGKAISGAKVCADYRTRENYSADIPFGALTDGEGQYSLEELPPGPQHIVATHPDYAPEISAEIRLDYGQAYSGVDFHLGTGGSVRGRVTEDSNPKKNAFVFLQCYASSGMEEDIYRVVPMKTIEHRQSTETDENGEYSVYGLPGGYCTVRVSYSVGGHADFLGAGEKKLVEITEGQTAIANFEFCEGGIIHGEVVDAASVQAQHEEYEAHFKAFLCEPGTPSISIDSSGWPTVHRYLSEEYFYPVRIKGIPIFNFASVCPGNYVVTVCVFARRTKGTKTLDKPVLLDQRSIPVTVERGKTVELFFDFSG